MSKPQAASLAEARARLRMLPLTVPLFAVLTAVSALVRIRVPGSMVPFTMQVYTVLLSGLAGGGLAGAAAQSLYLAAGALGLPVFAASSGLAGPTGGYLVGFVGAAALAGAIAGSGSSSSWRLAAGALAGLLVIYACGAVHLALVWQRPAGQALYEGVLPFVPFDIAKAALAVATARAIR